MSLAFPPPLDAVRRLAGSETEVDPCHSAVRGARLPMLVTAGRERDYEIVFVNEAFSALTGYAPEDVLGRNPRFLQGPQTDPAAVCAIRAALESGQEISVEMLNYRKDGSAFWNGAFVSPVRAADGSIDYWFASQLDISPRKTREHALVRAHSDLETLVAQRTDHLRTVADQKTLLLHEVEHRVKNNLQLITALIRFQSRRAADPAVRAALQQVQDRVSAVSTAHRRLFQTEDVGGFDVAQCVRDLVDDLVGRTGRSEVAVVFDVEPVTAEAARAAPLALLINEILTQLLHGASAGGADRLLVSLRGDAGACTIELAAPGAGGVDPLTAAGGPAGIVDILSRQLGACVEWRDSRPGVVASITLPTEPA